MNVLFVCSGKNGNPGAIIQAQAESLMKKGLNVKIFPVSKRGLKGYLKETLRLRRMLRNEKFDIIHAHYGLTGIASLIARRKERLIVSFMGDDLIGSNTENGNVTKLSLILAKLNSILAGKFYDFSIVKSNEMLTKLKTSNSSIIPNGVDMSTFQPREKSFARKNLGISDSEIVAIFVSDPERTEKNFKLALQAVTLSRYNIRLIPVFDVPHDRIVDYYNSADVLLLTSFHEGSPNVIKEAMSCNTPIVSTDVGDVKSVYGNTNGCYLTGFDGRDVASKINSAVEFSQTVGKTEGRKRIKEFGLDSETIAGKIIDVYEQVLRK